MKKYFLDYYGDFSCIANKCKHNCCLLWEIAIDKKSLKKYKKDKMIKDAVDFSNCTLILNKNRCKMLDSDNLCKIIKEGKHLCQTCLDHPRFRSYYSNVVELGLGMTCEEACRIILTRENKPIFLIKGKEKVPRLFGFNREKYQFREKILNFVFDRSTSLDNRIKNICDIIGFNPYKKPISFYKEFISKLELLEKESTKKIELLDDKNLLQFNKVYEQILAYFINRYIMNSFDRRDMYSKTAFSILSTILINNVMINSSNTFSIEEVCRSYSTEIEYNEDNINKMWDLLDAEVKV